MRGIGMTQRRAALPATCPLAARADELGDAIKAAARAYGAGEVAAPRPPDAIPGRTTGPCRSS
jgi:hypothetical protein